MFSLHKNFHISKILLFLNAPYLQKQVDRKTKQKKYIEHNFLFFNILFVNSKTSELPLKSVKNRLSFKSKGCERLKVLNFKKT